MGWKSTVDITREEALVLIYTFINKASDGELAEIMSAMGFGDNINLPYFGHNFLIVDEEK